VRVLRAPSRTASTALLAAFLAALAPENASALTIDGVEFSDWRTIDVSAGLDLDFDTADDLYVFVPNDLYADQIVVIAEDSIFVEDGVDLWANDPPLLCGACRAESFDESGDVVLRIFDPLGDVHLHATRIVISNQPIPEPASLALVSLGLGALARRRISFAPRG